MVRRWNLPILEEQPLREWQEPRDVALVTTANAWEVVAGELALHITSRALVTAATIDHWVTLPIAGEVIYAVGGGLAVDGAKFAAKQHGLPLVCVPTALTVDAFLTWASGYRSEGVVRYIETQPPDLLVADYALLGRAPAHLRAAGICDVLSIATGLWDWRFAHEQGKNPPGMAYIPYAAATAEALLRGMLDCAEAAGAGDPAGLKQLLELLALEVQLCNLIGHSRPEEGSEHYFAYAVENAMGKGLLHGDLVSPGILLMAQRQGQDVRPLRAALEACHQRLDRIPPQVVEQTLAELPAYCARHDLPFGIAHTL
jgi:glycerol-1-phosphate dehydrogenase [NAD(P)+]